MKGHHRIRLLAAGLWFSGACASVPPAHLDPARDPANPRARGAPGATAGQLPADDPTLKVGAPPFESGESGTKEGGTGGHHHGGPAPASQPATPMEHEGHTAAPPNKPEDK